MLLKNIEKIIFRSMVFLFLLVLLVSCDLFDKAAKAIAPPEPEPSPLVPQAELDIFKFEVLSVNLSKSKTIDISGENKNTEFTLETEGTDNNLFTHKIDYNKTNAKGTITFTAKKTTGQQKYKVTSTSPRSSTKEKVITVRAEDPMALDMAGDNAGLYMKYVNTYDFIYDDSGTDADDSVSAYKPKTETGWHSLGSRFINKLKLNTSNLAKYPSILLKDNSKEKDLLKSPTGYTRIWTDVGSGGKYNGSIWLPIAPLGYVPLGVIAVRGYTKPKLSDIMTVKKNYTIDGKVGKKIWDDSGSGANSSVSIFEISAPDRIILNDSTMAPLHPETAIACPNLSFSSSCKNDPNTKAVIKMLLYKKLVVDKNVNTDYEPRLIGREPYVGYDTYAASVKIPFTASAIRDQQEKIPEYVVKYPFIYIQRQERYTSIGIFDNSQGTGEESAFTYTKETSWEKSKEETLGVNVGVEYTYESGVTTPVASTTQSITFSFEFNWSKTESNTYGETTSIEAIIGVAPGIYTQIVQVQNYFMTYRLESNGEKTRIGLTQASAGSIFKVLEYPYPDE